MIRKFLLPALCVGLLGGCASYGYSDNGYYYGRPSAYGSVGYGSGGGYYGGVGYGSPYGYSGYNYGYPYGYGGYGGYYGGGYPYYYRRPVVVVPRGHYHGDGHNHGGNDHVGNNGGNAVPPWRDLSRRAKPDRVASPMTSHSSIERFERPMSRPERPRMSQPGSFRGAPERDGRLNRKP